MYLIPQTILFVIVMSIILSFIENKSNFSSYIMIPLIVSLTTKYVIGDWDVGYAWTIMDLSYWVCLVGFSSLTLYIIKLK